MHLAQQRLPAEVDRRVLAFYLPQFHPIAENDLWWGKGFTEWTNVTKARPRFRGHDQPRLPADLGFYDLRLAEVRQAQAALASEHGVAGFVYYHYWFMGRQLLQRPLQEVRRLRTPDFPFAVCWANETWSRNWNGQDRNVLVKQEYSPEDDAVHIEHLLDIMEDDRYLQVEGRHLLLVYRVKLLPDARRTSDVWRARAARRGIDLHLCCVEGFGDSVDPVTVGFDAAVDFLPRRDVLGPRVGLGGPRGALQRLMHRRPVFRYNNVSLYADMIDRALARPAAPYTRYDCVVPGWDNSARQPSGARILHGSNPGLYEEWLSRTLDRARGPVFVNAWNEWAEGAYLEPDQRWGSGYLEATRRAVESVARRS